VRARPVTPAVLADELVAAIDKAAARRVAVDGAPPTEPGVLAAALVEPLRLLGRPVLHVPSDGFLKQASLRFERGRTNPDAYYEDWLDLRALQREVLAPARRVLPSLRDPATDRATRASYVDIPANGVVVVSGALLLGAGLDFDLTVHLTQSPAALARRTDPAMSWTLPAFTRYTEEVMPELLADVVVRCDDPRHPAVVEP
jgi:hypothetical protein